MPRPRLIAAVAPLLALGLSAQDAIAQDYPFSGLYWPSFDGTGQSNIDRRCALTFLDQRDDGTWTVYHADLDLFRTTGEIQYRKISEGTCEYTPETKVEACLVSMDLSYPEGAGVIYYDVILEQTDAYVATVMIDAASDWETVMQDPGSSDVGAHMDYLSCPFPRDKQIAMINPENSALSADELNALRFPTDELLSSPEVVALADVLSVK